MFYKDLLILLLMIALAIIFYRRENQIIKQTPIPYSISQPIYPVLIDTAGVLSDYYSEITYNEKFGKIIIQENRIKNLKLIPIKINTIGITYDINNKIPGAFYIREYKRCSFKIEANRLGQFSVGVGFKF